MRKGFGWLPMLAVALIVGGCDPEVDRGPEDETPGTDRQATVGPPDAESAADEADGPAERGPRPRWLREDGELEIEGTRYEAEPVLMILDRDRLEPIGSRDGVELYQPGWAEDPRKRIFAEEEPDRWRPFVRIDPLPG